jgi:ABC-type transporter Mla MlaB component
MNKRSQPSRRTSRRNAAAASGGTRGAGARKATGRLLRLPAQCTLSDADGLKLTLARLLRNVKPVTLDARAVQRIDTASMQLLAAFALERAARELAVAVGAASAEFLQAARLLGLEALLRPTATVSPGSAR